MKKENYKKTFTLEHNSYPAWVFLSVLFGCILLPVGWILAYYWFDFGNMEKIGFDIINLFPLSRLGYIRTSINNSWLFFSLPFCFLPYFLFKHYCYFEKYIKINQIEPKSLEKKLTKIGFFFWYIVPITLFMIGIFPWDLDNILFEGTSINSYLFDILHCVGGYGAYFAWSVGFYILIYPIWRSNIFPKTLLMVNIIFSFLILYIHIVGLFHPINKVVLLWRSFNFFSGEWLFFIFMPAFIIQSNYFLYKKKGGCEISEEKWFKIDSIIEIILGFIFIFLYIWFIYFGPKEIVNILCIIFMTALILISRYYHKEGFKSLGITFTNFLNSTKKLIIFTIIVILILYFIWGKLFPVDNEFYKNTNLWKDILAYTFTSFVQMYVLFAFFFRRYKNVFQRPGIAILLTAFTFSLFYIPNIQLMLFTFIVSIAFGIVYIKNPNLYSIAIFHSILLLFLNNVLLVYSGIGPACDLFRWSKITPFLGEISSINGLSYNKKLGFSLYDKSREVTVEEDTANIIVSGFIDEYVNEVKLDSASIYFNNNEYPIKLHNNVNKISFNQVLKIKRLKPGDYSLCLKLYVQDSFFYNYNISSELTWIHVQSHKEIAFDIVRYLKKLKQNEKLLIIIDNYRNKWLKRLSSLEFIDISRVFNPNKSEYLSYAFETLEDRGFKVSFIIEGYDNPFYQSLIKHNLINQFTIKELNQYPKIVIGVYKK